MSLYRLAVRRSVRVGAGLAVVAAVASAGLAGTSASYAAPLAAPTPAAPKVIFDENFENNIGSNVQSISSTATPHYSGTVTSYSADPYWTQYCDGDIVSWNTPYSAMSAAPISDCNQSSPPQAAIDNALAAFHQMAFALGKVEGESDATAENNDAVTAYTQANNATPSQDTQITNNTAIPLASGGRFIALSVDGAEANCPAYLAGTAVAQYDFYAGNFGSTLTELGTPVTGCNGTAYTGISANLPSGHAETNPSTIVAGNYRSAGATLVTGTKLGFALKNPVTSGSGNDAAFDNLRVLDVTPTLSKSFSSAEQLVGKTTTLTFTITNTSDLLAKDGWGFVDHLPKGLTVAGSTVGGTCKESTAGIASGSTAITVTNGQLAKGSSSCTVSFEVTSSSAATYTNGPGNVTTTGLNAPAPVKTTFVKPSLSITKSATPTTVSQAGELIHLTFVVKNTGNVALTDVKVTDTQQAPAGPLTSGPTCPRTTLAIGASMTCTGTYTTTAADVARGTIKDSAVATADGASGSAAAGVSATSAAAALAVAVVPPSPSVPAGGAGVSSGGSHLTDLGLGLGGAALMGAGVVVARRRMSS